MRKPNSWTIFLTSCCFCSVQCSSEAVVAAPLQQRGPLPALRLDHLEGLEDLLYKEVPPLRFRPPHLHIAQVCLPSRLEGVPLRSTSSGKVSTGSLPSKVFWKSLIEVSKLVEKTFMPSFNLKGPNTLSPELWLYPGGHLPQGRTLQKNDRPNALSYRCPEHVLCPVQRPH